MNFANVRFDKSAFGYRVDDVDTYVREAARAVADLTEENEDLESKLEVLATKLEEYKNDEDSLRAAVVGAQKLGDSIIRDSKNKAEKMIRDANIKAERMLELTQKKIEREQSALVAIQKEVSDFKSRLIFMYKQHLELISSLPDQKAKEAAAHAKEAAVHTKEDAEHPRETAPAPKATQAVAAPAPARQAAVEEQPHQPLPLEDDQPELLAQPAPIEATEETPQELRARAKLSPKWETVQEPEEYPEQEETFTPDEDIADNTNIPHDPQEGEGEVKMFAKEDSAYSKYASRYGELMFGEDFDLD